MFGIHNHQPVGNFEHVFARVYKNCYLPFIKTLEKHPKVRISLHHTGPLLEWIEKNNPEYFDRIRRLLARNQIELMGGGFYEPLLPIIPQRDALGQIKMMQDYINEKFGVTPQGMWLAERVWEPSLPSLIAKAGLKYVTIDDTHFYYSGMNAENMYGYYITEDQGETVSVFPINKELRYRIPFRLAEDTIEYFRSLVADRADIGVTLADDGEKFGEWPGTHKWVYTDGYLERLFTLLEQNSEWINMVTFSEYMKMYPANGKVYLPTASYDEMMVWSLPANSQVVFEYIMKDYKNRQEYDTLRPYFRGGFWRNFLVKYPEVSQMYSKMIMVSKKIEASKYSSRGSLKAASRKKANKGLYRAQCNCAYWHGLFGGVYLNYLRHAVYQNLIAAENYVSNGSNVNQEDYNADGKKELTINTSKYNVYLSPENGGQIIELDYRPKEFNLSNIFTRKMEAYHRKVEHKESSAANDQPQSIHDVVTMKEEGLDEQLHYDWYQRHSLIDHCLGSDTNIEDFSKCRFTELGDFVNQPYEVISTKKTNRFIGILMKRAGNVYVADKHIPLVVTKALKLGKGIEVDYDLFNPTEDSLSLWWGIELNLTLLAGNDPDRFYEIPNKKTKRQPMDIMDSVSEINGLNLVDRATGFKTVLSWAQPALLWRFPIETVSSSESGIEKTYQGSCIMPSWKIDIPAQDKYKLQLSINIEDIKK